jgi:hypothetical protein
MLGFCFSVDRPSISAARQLVGNKNHTKTGCEDGRWDTTGTGSRMLGAFCVKSVELCTSAPRESISC